MSETKKKRTKYTPDETKLRLLESGLQLFASLGFKGVTTRQLAAHAGVNQAAIPYHFGGKEELYLAVAERIVTFMDETLAELPKRVGGAAMDPAKASRAQLAKMLDLLVRTLVGQFASREHMASQRAFVIREYAAPGKAFEIIYKGGVERMHKMMTAIVSAALGLDPQSQEAIIQAHVIVGQVMGFAAGQAVLCRRLGREGYDQEMSGMIADLVSATALRATGLDDVDLAVAINGET